MSNGTAVRSGLAPERAQALHKPPRPIASQRLDVVLFVALMFVEIAPIWWFPYFPSTDGPSHLENAIILREYHDADRAFLREFYTISTRPSPNWLGHLLLAGLMSVVSPLVAEKILLTGYMVLLPLSVWYAVKAVRADAGFLALLAFPFVPNFFFHMGFHNFCYSLPLFFFVVGYWLKHRNELTWRRTAILGLLGLVLYFGHLVSLAAAWVVIGVHAVWLAYRDMKARSNNEQRSLSGFARMLWAKVAAPFWAFLPTLLLAAWFLTRPDQRSPPGDTGGGSRVAMLIKLEALVSYNPAERLVALSVSVFFLVMTAYLLVAWMKSWRARPHDGLLLAGLVFVNLCLVMPAALSGGLYVIDRLTLYPFFTLLLWFAAQPAIDRCRWAVRIAAVAATLAFVGLHTRTYARADDYMSEMLEVADAIEPDHTLLTLSFTAPNHAPDGIAVSSKVPPFQHIDGHIAARRHLVNLKNYEAATGYFPILYRPEMNPYPLIGRDNKTLDRGLHSVPPKVDFLAYDKATGHPVDYILIWGVRTALPPDAASNSITAQLSAGKYKEVPLKSAHKLAHLYRRTTTE